MSSPTSLFLPPNVFVDGGAYAASLISSDGDTTTLAIHCTAALSHVSADCGSAASTATITVAPTSFALTASSTASQSVVTITETCTLAPAASTAVCNIIADSGLSAPFNLTGRQYATNIHPVNITNAAIQTTASQTTTTTSTSSTMMATSTGRSSGTKTLANGKSSLLLMTVLVISAIIRY